MCVECNDNLFLITRATDTLGVNKVLELFVKKNLEILNDEWESSAEEAIAEANKEYNKHSDKEKAIAAALLALSLRLKKIIPKKKQKELYTLAESIFIAVKTKAAKKYKTDLVLTKLDKAFIKQIGSEGPYWIGNFYDTHISARIAEIGKRLVLKEGLEIAEAGKLFGEIITQELALNGGKEYLKIIPGRFSGNVENYNQIVTGAVAQRARTFGELSAIHGAGYERFRYRAVGDKRTCERCLELDGEEYSVQIGINKMEAVAYADSPEELKAILPWYNHVDEIRELSKNEVPMPPIHGRCRCWIEAV